MLQKLFFFVGLSLFLFFSSCRSHEDLIYFQNIENFPDSSIYYVNQFEGVKVTYGDIVSIHVYSYDPRASMPFNNQGASSMEGGATLPVSEYLIDEEGAIDFPVLGRINIEGLTHREIEDILIEKLKDGFIKDPVVDVRLTNFKIIILGEAGSGILEIPNNKVNIIEALALAGDISIYGDRKNVLLIREEAGERTFARLDITDAGIFNSQFFNLQNNDILYLEPVKYKTTEYNQNRINNTVTFATVFLTLTTFILTIFR